jgi:hypothetical protein
MNPELSKLAEAAANELAARNGKTPKINWDKLDTQIEFEGRAIKLPGEPAKMPVEKAIETLQRKLADEYTTIRVHEIIDAYPLDAAVAFVKAMTNLYGWSSPVPTPGFFGSTPPTMLSVKVGISDEDVIQCPFGSFQLPGIDKPVSTTFGEHPKGNGRVFVVYGEFKKKDKHLVLELANEARRIVKAHSIYRGKAIRLGVNDEGLLETNNPPEYMDVNDMSETDLIFSQAITNQIETNILVPIKKTERCRKLNIPLKRGVLLEGPFGTGKSLTARMVAKVAQDYGWTFILLDKVKGLNAALEFANRYAPAVVFAEDIDRIASERDNATNDLINTIDGVISKRSEIMTILTTNYADKLNPVILRPGRLDAVISLRAPDPETIVRLIRFYAGGLISGNEDLSYAAHELDGQIPSSIRECVERAKLGMVGRNDTKLSDKDILVSAQTMKNHLALLNKKEAEETDEQKLGTSLRKIIHNEKLDKIEELVEQVHSNVC